MGLAPVSAVAAVTAALVVGNSDVGVGVGGRNGRDEREEGEEES